jgi:hypothetical protein
LYRARSTIPSADRAGSRCHRFPRSNRLGTTASRPRGAQPIRRAPSLLSIPDSLQKTIISAVYLLIRARSSSACPSRSLANCAENRYLEPVLLLPQGSTSSSFEELDSLARDYRRWPPFAAMPAHTAPKYPPGRRSSLVRPVVCKRAKIDVLRARSRRRTMAARGYIHSKELLPRIKIRLYSTALRSNCVCYSSLKTLDCRIRLVLTASPKAGQVALNSEEHTLELSRGTHA